MRISYAAASTSAPSYIKFDTISRTHCLNNRL